MENWKLIQPSGDSPIVAVCHCCAASYVRFDATPIICEQRQSHFRAGYLQSKSLMPVAIVVENAFRAYNGRSDRQGRVSRHLQESFLSSRPTGRYLDSPLKSRTWKSHPYRPEINLEAKDARNRVLQEALHNSVKPSGVKHVEVRIMQESRELRLTISDSGKGFEVESAMQGKGLGLISMRERVRLVHGILEIKSRPMGGTNRCSRAVRCRAPSPSGSG